MSQGQRRVGMGDSLVSSFGAGSLSFSRVLKAGADRLREEREAIDALNVFPVPDGDTGTNMYLTIAAACEQGEKSDGSSLEEWAEAAATGALMGARGNSGVILSQFFRGFAHALKGVETIGPEQLANCIEGAVNTAYRGVIKPVEGTVLTVGKAASAAARRAADDGRGVLDVAAAALESARQALAETPMLLPALREAGVVDAGGKGLVVIGEGMLAYVEQAGAGTVPKRERFMSIVRSITGRGASGSKGSVPAVPGDDHSEAGPARSAQRGRDAATAREAADASHGSLHADAAARGDAATAGGITLTDDIEFKYCTEFLVRGEALQVDAVREGISEHGDSLLVVGDDTLLKVHIHTNHPGRVLEHCGALGDLLEVHVNNMVDQNRQAQAKRGGAEPTPAGAQQAAPEGTGSVIDADRAAGETRRVGVVAVSSGDGLKELFESLGVDRVVTGGQTMNPSTSELVDAVESLDVDEVLLLPNNGNVVLTAKQVVDLTGKDVAVVPTRSVPEGLSALIAYDPSKGLEENAEALTDVLSGIKTAEVTYAVRDARVGTVNVKKDSVIGVVGGEIVEVADDDRRTVLLKLVDRLVDDTSSLVSVYSGEDVPKEEAEAVKGRLQEAHPECEVELHHGGQPVYWYLIGVE